MRINAIIKAAVEPIVPVCVPELYTGEQDTYCTFRYSEFPRDFGDDRPAARLYLVQVHLFLPVKANPLGLKRKIRQALLAAGFTAPQVENATDEVSGHYVFECEYAEGWDDGA